MQRNFLCHTVSIPLTSLLIITLLFISYTQSWAVPPAHVTDANHPARTYQLWQPDTEAPTAPGDLTATDVTQTSVTLTWTAATDSVGVVGYRLYERVRVNPYYWLWLLRMAAIENTTVTVTNLAPGSLHRYAVTAVDAAGNESVKSTILQLYTDQPPLAYHPITQGGQPFAIVGELFHYAVAALGAPSPTFTLAAGPNGMNVDATAGLVTWAPTVADEGMVTATVRAVNRVGVDDHTFTFPVYPANTDLTPPGPVAQLTAQDVTTRGATLQWTAAVDNVGVIGYRILAQGAGHGQGLFLVGDTGAPVTTFTITSLEPARSYRLWVAAYDAAGNVAAISGVAPVSIATLSDSADTPILGLVALDSSPTLLGASTLFTATLAGGTNVSYQWAFGDGALATGPLASHRYPTTGVYTATVTAANSLGQSAATTAVLITSAPLSNTNRITVTPPTPTMSDPISLTVSGVYTNNCTPAYKTHQRLDNFITITSILPDEPFCLPVETAWAFTLPLAPLPVGHYTIAHFLGNTIRDVATFTVTATLTPSIQPGVVAGQALVATVDALFHYQVQATGAAPLRFALTAAPAGMKIDEATGQVEWRPQRASETPVAFTVSVTNAMGHDDYTFQVQVLAPTANRTAVFLPLVVD